MFPKCWHPASNTVTCASCYAPHQLCIGGYCGEMMAMRNATDDWRCFAVGKIPTKESTPHLDRLLSQIGAAAEQGGPISLLDVGCGDGRLSKRLHDQGLCVTGVDISPAAVAVASRLAGAQTGATLRFAEADFAADQLPRIEGGPFDVVVCQLVLSIIGDDRSRNNLLRHIRTHLRPNGWLFISASGVSDAINPGYARLYAEDAILTGEPHSYFSRNEQGAVLYMTHHFTVDELENLLQAAGFAQIEVRVEREASSRRPEEAAFFFYATCRPA